ncbi:SDR family NAD(P)-dependent oxidoreductase [Microbacterium sp. SORGH_AS_0888]|uniref:SDR family NAD(P)-dependent oxidoreductase n=1 Tax=Microbacterium sp. SORGH_AS_0888 TaxID=3041791 RepID=UPI002785C08C|nr:SDR family NAD(P)-dependent oxidoreductase [Microbacterium sp. SORGH_AS_0888]MDQ1128096.1 NAD(P)-dependent dehydrogenase (short-subunit alcohol dehydrogenase family) [Microbacterium sp. SORGH_AS_0888]
MDIAGTVALVTGGASGLGLATARRLLARGADVVIADLPTSRGAEVAAEFPGRVRFAPGDVRSETDVAGALQLASELGDLRIVVTCAGLADAMKVTGRAGTYPLDRFRRVIDVNLVGTFNVIRLAAAHMQELALADDDERGVIVNTASVAAFDGQIGQSAYSASKAAIVGLTLPIARELAASRIRVVTIAPGTFDTPLLASLPEAARISLGSQAPHPSRLGHPDEFGLMVTQIVENPMLNGETIRLDAAIRMAPR